MATSRPSTPDVTPVVRPKPAPIKVARKASKRRPPPPVTPEAIGSPCETLASFHCRGPTPSMVITANAREPLPVLVLPARPPSAVTVSPTTGALEAPIAAALPAEDELPLGALQAMQRLVADPIRPPVRSAFSFSSTVADQPRISTSHSSPGLVASGSDQKVSPRTLSTVSALTDMRASQFDALVADTLEHVEIELSPALTSMTMADQQAAVTSADSPVAPPGDALAEGARLRIGRTASAMPAAAQTASTDDPVNTRASC